MIRATLHDAIKLIDARCAAAWNSENALRASSREQQLQRVMLPLAGFDLRPGEVDTALHLMRDNGFDERSWLIGVGCGLMLASLRVEAGETKETPS